MGFLSKAKTFAVIVVSAGASIAAAVGTANILGTIGFGAAGVGAGTMAAGIQSAVYGAAVPAGSFFATLQSWGATGAVAAALGVAAVVVGIAVFIGIWAACREWRK